MHHVLRCFFFFFAEEKCRGNANPYFSCVDIGHCVPIRVTAQSPAEVTNKFLLQEYKFCEVKRIHTDIIVFTTTQ